MAIGSHTQSAFALIYVHWFISENLAHRLKTVKEPTFSVRPFYLFLFCISLGAMRVGLGFLFFATSPLRTLLPSWSPPPTVL